MPVAPICPRHSDHTTACSTTVRQHYCVPTLLRANTTASQHYCVPTLLSARTCPCTGLVTMSRHMAMHMSIHVPIHRPRHRRKKAEVRMPLD